ncbi:cell division control protein 42, putative [Babesia ovata]|uniref:Cell division control protein 42, putative n=1 Tax=Babesia ovata TaxID=189622 RepID=A0A2H6KGK4_9APIC|nr:cell division control protein 42, putative [Babesia ovata]GBE62107.1 cell division control protein 42, putative [Babesia ovata]
MEAEGRSSGVGNGHHDDLPKQSPPRSQLPSPSHSFIEAAGAGKSRSYAPIISSKDGTNGPVVLVKAGSAEMPSEYIDIRIPSPSLLRMINTEPVVDIGHICLDENGSESLLVDPISTGTPTRMRQSLTDQVRSGGKCSDQAPPRNSISPTSSASSQQLTTAPGLGTPISANMVHSADAQSIQTPHRTPESSPSSREFHNAFSVSVDKVPEGPMSPPSHRRLDRNPPSSVLSSVSAPGGYFNVYRSNSTPDNRDHNSGSSFSVSLSVRSGESSTTGASSGTLSTMTPSSEESLVIESPPNSDIGSHIIQHSMAPVVRRISGNTMSREVAPRDTPRNHADQAAQFPQQFHSYSQREVGAEDSLGNNFFSPTHRMSNSGGLNGLSFTDAPPRQSTGRAPGSNVVDGVSTGRTIVSPLIHRELLATLGEELRNVCPLSGIGGGGRLSEPSGILSHRSADEGRSPPHRGSEMARIRQDNIERYIASGNFFEDEGHLIAATNGERRHHEITTRTGRRSSGDENASAPPRVRLSNTEEMGDGLIVKLGGEAEHAVDDEEEGSIFLIPDNFNLYAASFGDPVVKSSSVNLDDDVQMYTARGQESEDDQPYTGSETLNFTFSYSDAPAVIQSQEESNSSGSSPYGIGALSFSASRDLPYEAAVSGQGPPGTLAPSAAIQIEDLQSNNAFSAVDKNIESYDAPMEGMTFSDRVQLFVARRASEHGPDSLNQTDSKRNSVGEINLDEDYIKAKTNIMTSIEYESAEEIACGATTSSPSNLGTPENSNVVETMPVYTAFQESVTRPDISNMGTLMPLITENERLELERSQHPLSPPRAPEGLMHTDDAINKLYSVIPSTYSTKVVATTGMQYIPGVEMVAENAIPVPYPSQHAPLPGNTGTLHMRNFYTNLVGEKSRLHSDTVPPYDVQPMPSRAYEPLNNSKRIKLSDMSPRSFNNGSVQMGANNPIVMPEAAKLVNDAHKRVRVVIGAKLCEDGYNFPTDTNGRLAYNVTGSSVYPGVNTLPSSLIRPTSQNREVREGARQMLSEVVQKLKNINAAKEKIRQSCLLATKHSPMLVKANEVYCSVAKECRQLTKSIQQRQEYIELQKKLIDFKTKQLNHIRQRVGTLKQRIKVREANAPKLQHMEHLIETLRNIYAATGIRVVPLDAGSKNIRWVFAIFFNADPNTRRYIRSFKASWHNDLVRAADQLIEGAVNKPLVYHRIKAEQRFNPEINMVVCMKTTDRGVGRGNLPSSMRSVLRCGDESSPDVEAIRTPYHRAHVPAFRSDEWSSSSPGSSTTPSVTRGIFKPHSLGAESTHSSTSDADTLETEDTAIEFPQGTSHITVCPVNWDELVDVEDVSRGLRVVFTAPRFKTGGGSDKVWEQVLARLLEAANKRMHQLISRLMTRNADESHPITLIALIREIMDYGSALSARIRVVQRELLQLLTSTCGGKFATNGDIVTIEVVLTPQMPKRPSLLCSVDVDAYDLLQKGSYARAARNIRFRAIPRGYESLLRDINAAMSAADRNRSIYDFIVGACAQAGHMLYKHGN